VIKLLGNPILMQEYSANLRKKVENEFSLERMAKETLDVYKQALQDKKILVVKLGGLGDLILATPSLKILRKTFPHAKVSLLIDERFKAIMENCPYVDQLILFDRKNKKSWELISELQKNNFDISIDFKNSDFTHIVSYLAKIPLRYGFSRGISGFLLNCAEKLFKDLPEEPVKQQFRLLNKLGVVSFDDALELWPAKQDDEFIKRALNDRGISENDKVVGLAIGASLKWPTKNWPIENFSQLSKALIQKGFKVVLLGEGYLKEKLEFFPEDKNIVSFIGDTNLSQLISLIKRLNVLVTPDSAPMHIASAVKTKIIALFGPTDPKKHIPPAKEIEVLVKHIDCQPCYKRNCVNKEKMACLKKISVEEVLSAITK
ncbi:MAG: lipopolysaccharide heptosyltransferase II, partial [Candidatus Omnitrophica bacterium]|nr:lipopolysaccharide heptosyltransferase II [Candidatus Omnitrophota bacterium]